MSAEVHHGHRNPMAAGTEYSAMIYLCAGLMVLAVQDGDGTRTDRNLCGLNSLTLVLSFLSDDPHQEEIDKLLPIERAPFSLAELDSAARQLGYKTSLIHWNSVADAVFDCPAIIHLRARQTSTEPDHFVACFGETSEGLCLAEFPSPPFMLPRHRLDRFWDGDVLYIEKPNGKVVESLLRESYWDVALKLGSIVLGLYLLFRIAREVMHAKARTSGRPLT
jgi:ABC-type bacteriocin/lantibiotic exporter with double-glycine peptidase domain